MDEENKPHIITNPRFMYISLDKERGPGGGYIESVGPKRDGRWENVWASIRDVTEEFHQESEVFRFHIEVTYAGTRWYSNHHVLKEDLEIDGSDVYGFVLDKMVEYIDDLMIPKEGRWTQT